MGGAKNGGRTRRRLKDWVCKDCGNLNFSFRVHCNRCSTLPARLKSSSEASTASGCSQQSWPSGGFGFKVLLALGEDDWEGPPFRERELGRLAEQVQQLV